MTRDELEQKVFELLVKFLEAHPEHIIKRIDVDCGGVEPYVNVHVGMRP